LKILLLIIPFIAIVLYEAPPMIQKKRWRDLAIFSAITLFAFTISLLQVIGVNVPNPIEYLELLFDKIAR